MDKDARSSRGEPRVTEALIEMLINKENNRLEQSFVHVKQRGKNCCETHDGGTRQERLQRVREVRARAYRILSHPCGARGGVFLADDTAVVCSGTRSICGTCFNPFSTALPYVGTIHSSYK